MNTTVYLHGTQTNPACASQIIATVREGGIDAALVSTWDGLSTDPAAADDLRATRRGWLARNDAEVRWRREGDRVLVTVVSESPIDELPLQAQDVAEVTTGPTTRPRPDDGAAPQRLTYIDAAGEVLAARDLPTATNGEG